MAKHFSEYEKQTIKLSMLKESKKLFEKYGIKKTSIDKIVESVGIAKGSFYNFYDSKESMAYDLILDIEAKMHDEEMKNLHSFLQKFEYPEALKYTVWKSLNYMNEEPLLRILNNPQLLHEIWSKMNENERQRGICQDQSRVQDFLEIAKKKGYKLTESSSVFNAALLSFFMIYINQSMVGESGHNALEFMMKAAFEKLFIKD
ncbi:TetR/AcrR family transcriptional regulator [Anaerocolumna jejuensis]|uniref:TetR/AcrR family transcriptional regulator n=1 Tax=Anaerocolumna jejuensis TaxID=259063 RepID=UPI003F7CAB47